MAIAPFNPPGNRRIAQLPPTIGIKDPAMREFADAMTNILNSRSGDVPAVADQRFITEAEFKELAGKSMIDLFSTGVRAFGAPVPGAGTGTGTTPTATEQLGALDKAFKDLEDAIRRSILYQILGTQFQLPQITELRKKFEADLAKQGFSIIQTINAQKGLVETVEGIAVRVDDAEAAIITEMLVRADDDTALARVINTLWATIGDNTSIIEDGALAAAGQVSAAATKWDAVTVAVTDPNTGLVDTVSIRERMEVYANQVNSALLASYTVRTQISTGGQLVVGGFGLTATVNPSPPPGSYQATEGLDESGGAVVPGVTIDFGVRADRFFIAATSSGGADPFPSDATQLSSTDAIPFIVLSSPQVINGVTYPVGVWMRRAVIQEAQIGTANIIVANITTLTIAGNAVTIPVSANQVGSITLSTTFQSVVSVSATFASGEVPANVIVNCLGYVSSAAGTTYYSLLGRLSINGGSYIDVGVSIKGQEMGFALPIMQTVDGTSLAGGGVGTHTFDFQVRTDVTLSPAPSFVQGSISVMGAKR